MRDGREPTEQFVVLDVAEPLLIHPPNICADQAQSRSGLGRAVSPSLRRFACPSIVTRAAAECSNRLLLHRHADTGGGVKGGGAQALMLRILFPNPNPTALRGGGRSGPKRVLGV